ncbi:DUF6461 domain-containing protein [Streptomyces sp. NBC_01622]|uniref:DUF6461 domain-containing protein n=1 Tax=Streptomyces sp. NBC_01622 TaxID=2975903 RepID=UPI0038697B8C|nr:DUF6461 domain-containing protein [Streptomyces sp. NBC_01622]
MTESSPNWDWMLRGGYGGMCLTFTHGVTPEAVLRRYGADPSQASSIAFPQVYELLQPGPDSSILRVGSIREWTFCCETLGVQGIMPAVLAALSQDTQTVAVNHGANALHTLEHWVDGQPRERFEPGQESSLQAADVHPLWDTAERHRADHHSVPAVLGALEAVGDRIGGHLTADIVAGPLLTTALPWTLPPLPSPAAPLPFVHAAETRPLGSRIGTFRPPTR